MSPLSLQAHLVSSQPQPSAVLVDPRGFKTAIQSLTNFLISYKIPATLWLKLPKDDAWWTDIWQYGRQAAGCTIYTLGEQIGDPPDGLAASLRPIPIGQDNELKREYLCLAVADDFVGSLLAARLPSNVPTSDKRTLELYCSTSGRTVAALSNGLKAIVENALDREVENPLDVPAVKGASKTDQRSIAAAAVLSQWERCFPLDLPSRNTQLLTDAFVTWQLRFQEDLRSQLVTYRNATRDDASEVLYSLSPDFLAQAGQELQSPLTTIKTALTLLGSPTLKLSQRQLYLDMIAAQCKHQKLLIDSIINLLQVQTAAVTPPQSLQLAEIIPGIVSTYQPIAEERGIMLAYTVLPNLSEVLGIEAELKQVLIQLIKNGIQMTPKGGRVWVAVTSQYDDFVTLSVQDSGSGISKTDTAKLFEAFYRSPSNGGDHAGAGLGLTLVQQLIKRMGGSVSVDSMPGQGTTFKIMLPVVHRIAPIEPRSSDQPPITAGGMPSSHSFSRRSQSLSAR
ncbi:MAG: ATP-binding protein [Phormidesmis sp.]